MPRRLRILPVAAIALCALVAGALTGRTASTTPAATPLVPGGPPTVADPFAYREGQDAAFVRRATAGSAHLLYTLSPGGAEASAARTARWRPLVDAAARSSGVSADTLEGLVFLESAGRADAVTPAGLDGAVGLTQILAETARNLLGLRVDVAASERLTRRIDRASSARRRNRLAAERARVDQRFDPRASLSATARYLAMARKRFGREDLAFVSYHMGMGNLESVLRDFSGGRRVPYAQVYFASTPATHPAAWRLLSRLGDDSANYLWKVLAGAQIMRLWRTDRAALGRLAALHAEGAARALYPDGIPAADPVAVPDRPDRTGLRVAAPTRIAKPALAMALYIGAHVRALSGTAPLQLAGGTNWTFAVARRYRSPRQAVAFQFELDRLQTLHVLAWTRTGRTIEVTAGPDAKLLDPLLARVGSRP